MKEKIEIYLRNVATVIECDKCRELFLKDQPLIVFVCNQHAHPTGYKHRYDDPELGLCLNHFSSLCGRQKLGSAYAGQLYSIDKLLIRVEFVEELLKLKPRFLKQTYPRLSDLDDEFKALLVQFKLTFPYSTLHPKFKKTF